MGALSKDPNPPRRQSRPGSRCTVAEIVAAMDDDDRAVVLEWVNARHLYPASAVASKLVEHGYDVGKSSVERHRRQDCHCRVDRPEIYG